MYECTCSCHALYRRRPPEEEPLERELPPPPLLLLPLELEELDEPEEPERDTVLRPDELELERLVPELLELEELERRVFSRTPLLDEESEDPEERRTF
ncbi:MAG TPA: hypothetical protein PLZ01_11085 [bacterium]|nr:hypothetical protein [bacterium]